MPYCDSSTTVHTHIRMANKSFNPQVDYTSDEEDISADEMANVCVICGVDMGDCNPRQFCRKTYCPYESFIRIE
jgi:hypothetical protein